jgi:hypothetical protein
MMAVIFPGFGKDKMKELAQVLLLLADDPRDVVTNTDNGFAFVVPEYLHDKYVKTLEPEVQTPAMVEQSKRRPGRPRKSESEKEGD